MLLILQCVFYKRSMLKFLLSICIWDLKYLNYTLDRYISFINQCVSFCQGSAPECEPMEPLSLWENKVKSWMERYEEASSNQYSEDVRLLLRVKEARDGKTLAYNTHTAAFKPPVEVHTLTLYTFTLHHSQKPDFCWFQKESSFTLSRNHLLRIWPFDMNVCFPLSTHL